MILLPNKLLHSCDVYRILEEYGFYVKDYDTVLTENQIIELFGNDIYKAIERKHMAEKWGSPQYGGRGYYTIVGSTGVYTKEVIQYAVSLYNIRIMEKRELARECRECKDKIIFIDFKKRKRKSPAISRGKMAGDKQ